MQQSIIKLYSAEQAKEIDQLAQVETKITGFQLMGKAASAVMCIVRQQYPSVKNITVVCGVGNNAGDGYLLAKLAMEANYVVTLIAIGNPEHLSGDAALAKQAYIEASGLISVNHNLGHQSDLIVDALFGTGLDRPVTGSYAAIIKQINSLAVPVLAIDIPSGLNANTGNIMGCAIQADHTITFIVYKKGLLTGLAAEYCGQVIFADLDIQPVLVEHSISDTFLIDSIKLLPRKRAAHKGNFGHVLVVGGDYGYAGAICLAAKSALMSGAGLVSVATRKAHAQQIHLIQPELMAHALEQLNDVEELLTKATVLVLGPGLGQKQWAKVIWQALIGIDLPRVIDADALNLLAENPIYSNNWILTPHPGEAARLLNCSTADILQDRFLAVRQLQKKYGGICILKGAGTLICAGREIFVNSTGNPGMAAGGMGDVLSGVIAGLLAQKFSLLDAAKAGVYLHGLAADKAAENLGERGLCASDVIQFLPRVVN